MKIALAGYGLEGKASYDYWNRDGNDVVIADERTEIIDLPHDTQAILGPDAFSRLGGFDLIIRSPSVDPEKLPYGEKVWSATNEFFAKCPARIIGVTGTKGKGTTSSLIASILGAAGRKVHLVGNIGTPAVTELKNIHPDDIVVFELSSFQLWDAQASPHIAVVLMIEPDHLDTHHGMMDYVSAKAHIVEHQTSNDYVIYNAINPISSKIGLGSKAKKVTYPFPVTAFQDVIKLPGKHNLENVSAAIAAVKQVGVTDDAIKNGLASFEGLPHRLELVRLRNGVRFYNDSFSSAPGATIAAIRSFDDPEILIIGGSDKGADFTELRDTIRSHKNIKKTILIGTTKHALFRIIDDQRCVVSDAMTMRDIIAEAVEYATEGDIILLSPGCASFDMFKNFYDRGDQFRTEVMKL